MQDECNIICQSLKLVARKSKTCRFNCWDEACHHLQWCIAGHHLRIAVWVPKEDSCAGVPHADSSRYQGKRLRAAASLDSRSWTANVVRGEMDRRWARSMSSVRRAASKFSIRVLDLKLRRGLHLLPFHGPATRAPMRKYRYQIKGMNMIEPAEKHGSMNQSWSNLKACWHREIGHNQYRPACPLYKMGSTRFAIVSIQF